MQSRLLTNRHERRPELYGTVLLEVCVARYVVVELILYLQKHSAGHRDRREPRGSREGLCICFALILGVRVQGLRQQFDVFAAN